MYTQVIKSNTVFGALHWDISIQWFSVAHLVCHIFQSMNWRSRWNDIRIDPLWIWNTSLFGRNTAGVPKEEHNNENNRRNDWNGLTILKISSSEWTLLKRDICCCFNENFVGWTKWNAGINLCANAWLHLHYLSVSPSLSNRSCVRRAFLSHTHSLSLAVLVHVCRVHFHMWIQQWLQLC